MKAHVAYRDIAKTERKALAAVAYRQSPGLRTTMLAALLVAILSSGTLLHDFRPGDDVVTRLVVRVGAALLVFAAIWEIFGRRKLRAEIEKIKNA